MGEESKLTAKLFPWRKTNLLGFSDLFKNEYKAYARRYMAVTRYGKHLEEILTTDWNERFPNGIDGKVCIFRVTEGKVYQCFVEKEGRE